MNLTDIPQLIDGSRSMEADTFFRGIEPDWYTQETGNVESPTGWFGVVTIDQEFRLNSGYEIPASVQDGTYLVQITSSGVVFAWTVDVAALLMAAYSGMEQEYHEWDNQDA